MRQQMQMTSARRIVLTCSGGRDSMVLAHLLVHHVKPLPAAICLLHIHHGLDEQARMRADHCVHFARAHALPYQVVSVTVRDRGMGPEAAARLARYQAWREFAHTGDLFWTAHHLHDQAETVLLQLMRGSGVDGLAAMPALRRFANGSWLGRPLLTVSGSWVAAYAQHYAVSFLDDPANDEPAYSRNYLRRQVTPLLAQHWPAWTKAVARAARHQAEAAMLLRSLAESLWRECAADGDTLNLSAGRRLPAAQQRLLLRHWLKQQALPLPREKQLKHALMTFLSRPPSAGACVSWHGAELRCYRDRLYALATQAALTLDAQVYEKLWPHHTDLDLPELGLRLHWHELQQQAPIIASTACASATPLLVRLRRGGERYAVVSPAGQSFHRPLKKVFQQLGVPPWQRQRLPLIYQDNELRLVWGWPLAAPTAKPAEAS